MSQRSLQNLLAINRAPVDLEFLDLFQILRFAGRGEECPARSRPAPPRIVT
jgi:hypothetical protein